MHEIEEEELSITGMKPTSFHCQYGIQEPIMLIQETVMLTEFEMITSLHT